MKNILIVLLLLCLGSYCAKAQFDASSTYAFDSSANLCTSTPMATSVQPIDLQVKSFFTSLFDTKSWPPRWQCGEWTSFHGWLYIASDLLIWLAYFAIPAILAYFIKERKNTIPFQSIFVLFIGFILACGLTHLIDAAIFWWPAYRLSAILRFITAGVSLGTVFALIKVMPKAIELKSPNALEKIIQERTKELVETNKKLENEIIQRQKAEEEINQLNKALEEKVREKTQDAQTINNKLAQMNELMESLQKYIHIGIWQLDLGTQKSYWSDEVFAIHELPVQESVNLEDGLNFYHPAHQKIIKKAIDDAISKRKSYDLELKLITHKNNEIWIRAIGVPIVEKGKTIGLKGVFQNIDHSKKIEEELRTSQEVLKLAIEAGEVGIFIWDTKKGILKNLNKYTNKHYGFPEDRKTLAIEELIKLVHPEDTSKMLTAVENDFYQQSRSNIDFRIILKNGRICYLAISGIIFRDARKKAERMVGIVLNITKFKELEATLRESEEKFRSAVEHSPIGKALVGLDGKFLTVNKALLEIVGYTEDELLHLDFQNITYTEDLDADLDYVQQLLAGTLDTYQMEKRYLHKDGHPVWVQLNGSMVRNVAGEPLYFIAQIQDITQRKNADMEINRINTMLKTRSEKLEVLNKELQSFSYSVSHDLRAPLRSIVGYAQILNEDYAQKLDDEGNKTLQIIINNARKMGQLIDDLLEFSRLGRKNIEKRKIDMKKMVEDVLQELQALEQDRKIKLKIYPLEEAIVDIKMIKQVWVNLISNALKYTRKMDIAEIEIGGNATSQEVCFYIRDNGVGFNMDYKNKLFNVFQRLHSADEFEGTGVGLALVKRIIDRHGGNIWAEAEENQGATFYFTIPK